MNTTILKENYFQINQKIGSFFVCKMSPKILKEIAKKDINRYENLDEIQRELKSERTKSISKYIYDVDYATFPNSFIISVWNDTYIWDDWNLNIIWEAYILDGQHRLSGFKEEEEDFEIIVSVYVGLDKFHQAMIFSNINWLQTKVNKSLIYSLYWFWDYRTPEIVTYSIIALLNTEQDSPWVGLIIILGKWSWVLSLAPFFEELEKEIKTWVFNKLYLDDGLDFTGLNKSDTKLYFILYDYYNIIKENFNEEWWNKDYILTKTTGFYWFFRLLVYLQDNNIDFSTLKWIKNKINPLTNEYYKAWWVGQKALYNDLKKALNL